MSRLAWIPLVALGALLLAGGAGRQASTRATPEGSDSRDLFYRPDDGRLGLRWHLVRLTRCGREELSERTVFRAGDRVVLETEANRPGLQLVVLQGSSGRIQVLAPAQVPAWTRVPFPGAGLELEFDDKPGTEILHVFRGDALPEQLLGRVGSTGDPADPGWAGFAAWLDQQSPAPALASRDLQIVEASSGAEAGGLYSTYASAELSEGRRWASLRIELRHE